LATKVRAGTPYTSDETVTAVHDRTIRGIKYPGTLECRDRLLVQRIGGKCVDRGPIDPDADNRYKVAIADEHRPETARKRPEHREGAVCKKRQVVIEPLLIDLGAPCPGYRHVNCKASHQA